MRKTTLAEKFQYWFDRTMTKGAFSQISWLALIALVITLISALTVWMIGVGSQANLIEQGLGIFNVNARDR